MFKITWPRLSANFFRQTPIRLTLVFLAVYVFVAVLVAGYIFVATQSESRAFGNSAVQSRLDALTALDENKGHAAVVDQVLSEDAVEWIFVKGVFDGSGQILAQNMRARIEARGLPEAVITDGLAKLTKNGDTVSIAYEIKSDKPQDHCCRFQGRILRLDESFYVFVAMDMSWAENGYDQLSKAMWGGGILVMLFGLFAGTLINQEVSRSVTRLTTVLEKARDGDLTARIEVRASGDEFDSLAMMINQTLGRMEKTMGNLKYAGDSIAHDLRSPLSRLRSKLEVSRLEVDKDPSQAHAALTSALNETDNVLRTFHTVFAISRLQAQGTAPDQKRFVATALANDMAELFEAVAEDKEIDFSAEIEADVSVFGNRDFLAQALSNLLDNALKYTPAGGGVTFRLRRNNQGEVEFSVTDTGPGVPLNDRARIIERFVRLENSRTLPGVGLGLAMVQAVAVAHKGRLMIDEGPGEHDGQGPGLRTALVLPKA